uniref:Uncharacterized protein n=1 Tax=Caenorhabditis japonica TaxID=281687 RepID=A0A8R1I1T7_CAEJA
MYVEQVLKEHEEVRRPRRQESGRVTASHPTPLTSRVAVPPTFRKPPVKSLSLQDNTFYEEELSPNDIVIHDSGMFGDEIVSDGNVQNRRYNKLSDEIAESDSIPQKQFCKKPGSICILNLGAQAARTPQESMENLHAQITKCTLSNLSFDTTALDELYNNGSGETKATCLMIRGLMTMIENSHKRFGKNMERWAKENKDTEISDVRVSLDPLRVKCNQNKVSIVGLDGVGVLDANEIISRIAYQSGSLRQVIYAVSNHWLNSIFTDEDLSKYSTSGKPQANLVPLPWRFLNAPAEVLVQLSRGRRNAFSGGTFGRSRSSHKTSH